MLSLTLLIFFGISIALVLWVFGINPIPETDDTIDPTRQARRTQDNEFEIQIELALGDDNLDRFEDYFW
jgi:hypothetical protein